MTTAADSGVRIGGRRVTAQRVIATALVLLVALGGPLALSQLGSTSDARFGANEELGPNALAAATLSIAPGPNTQEFVVTHLAPGDRARGRVDLVNDGSLPLRYSMSAETGSGELADLLSIEVWSASICADRPPSTSAAILPSTRLASDQSLILFGNARPGQQQGDRFLDPGQSETICYVVTLPIDIPDAFQALTVDQDLVVFAEHVLPGQPRAADR